MRVAFVVQRYGEEVIGGAEALARQLAQQMSAVWQVTVFTTTAKDYDTWKPYYSPGTKREDGVEVHRFGVTEERNPLEFSKRWAEKERQASFLSEADEKAFFDEQGPKTPAMIQALEASADQFDAFFFVTYLYYHTIFGLPRVAKKSYLLAAAHDEAPFYFTRTLRPIFQGIKGLIYQTPEELELVQRIYGLSTLAKTIYCPMGVDEPPVFTEEQERDLREKFKDILNRPFFLYLGRVAAVKGCRDLFGTFNAFRVETNLAARLVVAGQSEIEIPEYVNFFGRVSDVEKSFLLRNARMLINSSPYESLSLVVLESWKNHRPVLVNGNSTVLKGQVVRSDGGLYYHALPTLKNLMKWAATHGDESTALGHNGFVYVDKTYRWENTRRALLRGVT